MNRLDESDIIRIIQKTLGNSRFIPEDVESFNTKSRKTVVTVDTLVQSTDMPAKMKIEDAARKSIVACISDFASKGVKPTHGIISLNLPERVSPLQVSQIAQGIKQASKEFGIKILGGDTNRGKEFVFHACMFGTAKRIVSRKGANLGDLIFVSGLFGYAAAGLEIFEKNRKALLEFKRNAMKAFAKPQPRLDFALKSKRYFTSSMDSSDGLSATLNEMANQSKSKFVIEYIPADDSLEKFARLNKINSERLIFHGGEEYEFVFTVPSKYRTAVQKNARLTKTPIIEIGYVEKGIGVFVKNETLKEMPDLGWHHFK